MEVGNYNLSQVSVAGRCLTAESRTADILFANYFVILITGVFLEMERTKIWNNSMTSCVTGIRKFQ
jgi:hypothetical protein